MLTLSLFTPTYIIIPPLPTATEGVSPTAKCPRIVITPANRHAGRKPTEEQCDKTHVDDSFELMDYEDSSPSEMEPTKLGKEKQPKKLTLAKSRNKKSPRRGTTPAVVNQKSKKPMTSITEEITSYQIPREISFPEETADNIPDHLCKDLRSHLQSKLHYESRVAVFEGFARDGPFPSITHLQFDQSDPSAGLTMKYANASELEEKTKNVKKDIWMIHANNYKHLAEIEHKKLESLLNTANDLFNPVEVEKTLKRAKIEAYNKAREIRRNKNKNERRNNNQEGNKRRRSPSREREHGERHRR